MNYLADATRREFFVVIPQVAYIQEVFPPVGPTVLGRLLDGEPEWTVPHAPEQGRLEEDDGREGRGEPEVAVEVEEERVEPAVAAVQLAQQRQADEETGEEEERVHRNRGCIRAIEEKRNSSTIEPTSRVSFSSKTK